MNQRKSFIEKIIYRIIKKKPKYLIFFVDILEIYLSFSKKKALSYLNDQKKWILFEINKLKLNKKDKILFIGGGSIPYTAIILLTFIKGNVYVLDKSNLACFFAKRLLKKIGLFNKVKYINKNSNEFKNYSDFSVVYVASYIKNKEETVKKILSQTKKVKIIIRGIDFRLKDFIEKENYLFEDKQIKKINKKDVVIYKKYKNINNYFYIVKK